jgi:adenylate cyclase
MDTDEHALPEVLGDGAGRQLRLRLFLGRLDSQPGLLAAARRLRRRMPGDEKFGDPLSTAGITPVEVVARRVSTLTPERPSVAQELGFAGLQLWQALSEATGRGRGDQPLALLFTDLAGFSSWSLKAGDAAALELLRAVGTAVETAIHGHGGRIVKRLGDGVMATFVDVGSAVEAALEAQARLAQVEIDGYRPQMRAGIHWGRPRALGGDYLGVDVNVAARVADAAKGGEVVVSDPVLDQLDVQSLEVGRSRRLRADGTPRGMHVARVSRVPDRD